MSRLPSPGPRESPHGMSLQGIQEIVADAAESGTPLRIAGESHWIDAGRPVRANRIASLTGHTGVVDYVPGDLTITVKGGTTLHGIEEVTAKEGQHFPLDPHGSSEGTIGATIATGSSGPMAHGFGAVRDLVLGVEFVTGDGRVVKGGGRVVKNVAGFDLVRLITGSWGTLGIVTEATLRLYSIASSHATLAVSITDERQLSARLDNVLNAAATPYSVELVDAATARHCGLAATTSILVELGGNAAAVEAQKDALSRTGVVHEVPRQVWTRLRTADAAGTAVFRVSALPAQIAELWTNTQRALAGIEGSMIHASAGLGVVRCILPAASATAELLRRMAGENRGSAIVCERLPSDLWPHVSPSVVSDTLSQRVKRAFDPLDILNPGIMGEFS